MNNPPRLDHFRKYSLTLQDALKAMDWGNVLLLSQELLACQEMGRGVFICGNGGSAGNACHLANDFLYGAARDAGKGLKVSALSANVSVITCLANDLGYDHIFSYQIETLANPHDILIVLSGSGNSPNILKALETAKAKGMKTFAILGYSGGKAKTIADVGIHVPINDMQISEDFQLIVGHMAMQWLRLHSKASL
jgi:D-sedoheptulose 7-phosphate isomerase